MDLTFSAEDEAFRQEVRSWLSTAMPPEMREKAAANHHFSMPEIMEWHKILHAKGWVAPNWPEQFGGPGFSATQRFIFMEEMERAGSPGLSPFGLVMVGPLIQRFGNGRAEGAFPSEDPQR